LASRQGFGELKTEQLGGHSQEQQRHRQAPIDDDDDTRRSIVYYQNDAQWYGKFVQVGQLDRALTLLGLALYFLLCLCSPT